ncbi:MAG TPA: DUF1206 domain-containing protein [Gaiellaceae bacterium]|jgi:hypothetical protein|nr:DUF1206 domain-containing protein [Gaiellaceae bacterium]
MRTPQTAVPDSARAAGEDFVQTRAFEILSRVGFVARGLVYGIIGLLALDLATGHGGKITNQQGALRTVEHQPFGHVLLALVAIGLGGYSLWRLIRAALGHGPEGTDSGLERLGALGSGIAYGIFCAIAVELLLSSGGSGSSANASKTAKDVFAWPAGHWLVGAAGLVTLGVGAYQLIRGARRKFLDDSKTDRMRPAVKKWFTVLGTVGHIARAVVFGLVGVFLVKAAIDYKANEAIGLDGALAKLYDRTYGPWLLGIVAAGLVAFGVFSTIEARYRKI